MIEYVEGLGKEVKFHGKLETESVHYCNTCEVTNLLSMKALRIQSQQKLKKYLKFDLQ